MTLTDAVTELGLTLDQPSLTLGDHGACLVVFDDRLALEVQAFPDGRTLHLSGAVSILELETEASLKALLQANLLGVATGDACFSTGPDEVILLERRLDTARYDAASFRAAVKSFVQHLEAWEDRLAGGELARVG